MKRWGLTCDYSVYAQSYHAGAEIGYYDINQKVLEEERILN